VQETFTEPLRPWLPVDLLDNAARTISENKAVMLGLPVVGGIALAAVQFGLTRLVVPGGLDVFAGADPAAQASISMAVMYAVNTALFAVASSILSGVIALAAVRSQLGARLGARELLRMVRPAIPALIGVALIQSLTLVLMFGGWLSVAFGSAADFDASGSSDALIGVGMLLMLVGFVVFVIFGVRLTLAGTVVLMEGTKAPAIGLSIPARVGVLGAIKRSWRLVRGKFWRVLGILLFGGIVVWIVSQALQLGIGLLAVTLVAWTQSGNPAAEVLAIATGIATAASMLLVVIASLAFLSAVQALIYLDLRVRREGLDLWLRPALLPAVRR
jgi:hypothetical protein